MTYTHVSTLVCRCHVILLLCSCEVTQVAECIESLGCRQQKKRVTEQRFNYLAMKRHLAETFRWPQRYKLLPLSKPGLRSRRFLGGVGFLTTLGVEFFCPTPDVQLDHILHHTRKLGIPVEMVQFLLKLLLKQRFLAVHHDFH